MIALLAGLSLAAGPLPTGGAAVGSSEGPRSTTAWDRMGDAELLEASGDPLAAAEIYEDLARSLADDDPARAEALYHAGRLFERLGRTGDAVDAFDACVRVRAWRERCLAERGDLEILRSAVTSLPVRWTFDDTHHGLVHPGLGEGATLRIQRPADEADPVLDWHTRLARGEVDQLVVGVALPAGTGPTELTFEARSPVAPSWLRVRALDLDGRTWSTPEPIAVDDTARLVTVDLRALAPDTGSGEVDPALLHRILLEDQTMLTDGEPVERDLLLDDFTIR